jgi:Arc/MetJ-type ribon-helix-helix transcriptional regulator
MAAKVRINITVDPQTLRLADREARRRRISRSELIRKTLQEMAKSHENTAREEARRKRRRQAAEAMDLLAREFGDWPAEEILRASRDRWPRRAR